MINTTTKEFVLGTGSGIIAIDIGTTNIEAGLFDSGKNVIDLRSETNSQRRFGSDIASRIVAASSGRSTEMRACVLSQICGMITSLVTCHPDMDVQRIGIAGNTTMLHILSDYDCSGLGTYPFTPVSLKSSETTTYGLIGDLLSDPVEGFPDIPVVILPGISAYIGADVYAGVIASQMALSDRISLLIDLGTNAELVLGSRKRLLAASAAAGPAFESNRIFKGTEGIEMLNRLLALGVIDNTGLMGDEYFEKTAQKNIRRLQLAKAAIHAAILVLLNRYGISEDEIDKVFISGNFGNNLDIDACISVGMLPESFRNRTEAAGNTVLSGCFDYCSDPSRAPDPSSIGEIVLANEPEFNGIFMDSIDL